jgi:hypothetical protein
VAQAVPRGHNAFAYVFEGKGRFGTEGRPGGDGQMILFAADGDEARFEADPEGPLQLLFIAGAPIGEAIVRYGPFVMNTEAEIREAIEDYRRGRLGRIER